MQGILFTMTGPHDQARAVVCCAVWAGGPAGLSVFWVMMYEVCFSASYLLTIHILGSSSLMEIMALP